MRGWNLSPWSVEEIWSGLRSERRLKSHDPSHRPRFTGLSNKDSPSITLPDQPFETAKDFFMLQIIQFCPVSGNNENCQQIFQGQLLFADVKNKSPFFALHVLSNCLTRQNEWIVTSFLRYSTGIRLSYATLFATCITLFVTCFAFL